MTGTIIGILAAAAGSVGAYFTWKSTAYRQRAAAKKDIEAEEAEAASTKAEIEAAVYGCDDEKVNRIVGRLID